MTKVKQVKLSDIVDISYGSPVKANTIKKQGVFPVVKISNFSSGEIKLSDMFIDSLPLDHKNTFIEGGEILVAMSGSTGKAAFNSHNIKAIVNQRIAILRADQTKVDVNYLKHIIVNCNFENYCQKMGTGMQKNITNKKLGDYKIFLPDLSSQTRISSILDKFTLLEAELEAELTARTKQYNYYLDKLLTFEENEVEWKELGEIGKVSMCRRIFKSDTQPTGEVPFYKIGTFGKEADAFISKNLFDEYKEKYSYPKKGDILFSASGTIGRRVIFDGFPSYFQDSNIVWIDNDESIVLNKFLYYYYTVIKWNVSSGGTIKRLYNKNISTALIPVPPLIEQERIISILDKFDSLTTSLTEGLPYEIELRQKQYEYYRNKLLTFDKD